MTPIKLITDIRRELKRYAETEYQRSQQWFFKEEVALLGVRVGRVRMIGNQFYNQIKDQPKAEIFTAAEELMKIDMQEFRVIGMLWARKQQQNFTKKDFPIFERWTDNYVTNWAVCDGVSQWLVGELLRQYPALIPKTRVWRKSPNRWVRRAAAVALIPTIDTQKSLIPVFACADDLLTDEDDMVQKGYGWLLKEASNTYPRQVLAYVLKRKVVMPRTALRYAIEKLPELDRRRALTR